MLKKPSLLFFFSIFLIFEPIYTLAFISIEREFEILHIIKRSVMLSPIELFNFWFLFPISGFLLLSIRSYTYILFILLQLYNLIFHLTYDSYAWPYLSATPNIPSMCLLGVNVFIVIYMLLPDIRKPFFDRNLRWWERASRFNLEEPCYYTIGNEIYKSELVDFSETGALIKLGENNLVNGNQIRLEFNLLDKDYELNCEVVRELESGDNNRLYGVRFIFENIIQRYTLKFLQYSIRKSQKYSTVRK